MDVSSSVPDLSASEALAMLAGLPEPQDYQVYAKPLRYRDRPHLAAWTDFEDRSITLQLPEPFHPFGEIVPYGAKRRTSGKGKRPRFIWLTEGDHVPNSRGGPPVLLLPRMDALVAPGGAGDRVGGGDDVRSVRAAQLPAPDGRPRATHSSPCAGGEARCPRDLAVPVAAHDVVVHETARLGGWGRPFPRTLLL